MVETTLEVQCIEFQVEIEDEFQIKVFVTKDLCADILIGFQIGTFVQYIS